MVVVGETPPPEPPDPAIAGAAVEIAEIQAARDVTIAEIEADADDAETEEYIAWLRNELAGLQEARAHHAEQLTALELTVTAMAEQLLTMATALSILSLPSPETPPLTAEEPPSAKEAGLKAENADPAPEAPPVEGPARRTRRWLQ